MKAAILDGTEKENPIGNSLISILANKGINTSYFKLKDLNIGPCRSCGSCGMRTPGQCVIQDDTQVVVRAMANSNFWIFLTPITFGGYSYQLKKALDRFMLLCMPLYFIKGGHMLHPMRYGCKQMLEIGLSENNQPTEIANFRLLTARNAMNFQNIHQTLIFQTNDDAAGIEYQIEQALRGVG